MEQTVATPADPVVLLLEDSISRVQWLRKHTRTSRINLVWVTSVTAFREALEEYAGNIALIVLDHDIPEMKYEDDDIPEGLSVPKYYDDGLNGLDAARSIPASYKGDVLVWSWNTSGALAMIEDLERREILCLRDPFTTSSHYEDSVRETIAFFRSHH